jgi:hypothetical protein
VVTSHSIQHLLAWWSGRGIVSCALSGGTGNGSDLALADLTATMMKTMNQPNSFQRLLGGPGAEGLHRRK